MRCSNETEARGIGKEGSDVVIHVGVEEALTASHRSENATISCDFLLLRIFFPWDKKK